MSKDDADFSRAMQQLGVRPLKESTPVSPKRKATPETKTRISKPPAPPPQPVVAQASAEMQKVAAEAGALRERIAALEGLLEEAQEGKALALADAARLAEQLNEPAEGSTPLGDLLQERGLRGQEEARRAMIGLLEARRWDSVGSHLGVHRVQAGREALVLGIFLHCGGASCVAPESCAVVEVPVSRCEVCGGKELRWEGLTDALLLAGMREMVVVGGHPHVQGMLRENVDRRIQVRALPGHAPIPQEAGGRLAEARLVVGWGSNPVAEGTAVQCDASSLAGLIDFVIDNLAQR